MVIKNSKTILFVCLFVCNTSIARFEVVFVVIWKDFHSEFDTNKTGACFGCRRRYRLKGIHSRSDTSRTGAEGLSFYYPRLLHCLNQMLAVVLLSQHRVSSSKTVRPRAPYGARCIEHAVSTWSAVCSEAPHSQFGEETRPHLCMDEWNRQTPVRRQLSLTQAARGKPSQQAWHRPRAQKHGAWKHFHSPPFSICDLSIQKGGCQVWQDCSKDSAHLAQTGVWILISASI